VNTLFFQPYNRGVALGHGKVFFGSLDGRVIALDMKTGKEVWAVQVGRHQEVQLQLHWRPARGQGQGHLGSDRGEYPTQGKIFGLKAASGEKAWEFNTIRMTRKAGAATPGNSVAAAAG